uniref:SFRICE_030419 n=1 Tax=Spodoptera frugiperda TaxID=7108 RepID=A0A2H1W151_SPOFR
MVIIAGSQWMQAVCRFTWRSMGEAFVQQWSFKQVRESGVQSALSKRLQVSKPRCTTKMSSFSSVGLMDMRPVLILMLYGVCLSVIILFGEIVLFRFEGTIPRRAAHCKLQATTIVSMNIYEIDFKRGNTAACRRNAQRAAAARSNRRLQHQSVSHSASHEATGITKARFCALSSHGMQPQLE